MSSGENERVNKAGIWSKADIAFLQQNHLIMSVEDIAAQLQRNPVTVARYIKNNLGYTEPEKLQKQASFEIKKSPLWNDIKRQFSPDEQEAFEYHWANLMAQFRHDVLPTERMQMVEVVRLEILLGRLLEKLYKVDVLVNDAQSQLTEQKLKPIEERDLEKISKLEMVVSQCHSSHQQMTKEYKELLERKDKMLISIRGSRDQRIKRIEDSKETIQTWMASLADSPELRRAYGIEMRKQQLAMEVELKRLTDYHVYADGEVNQPILNCDTIKEDNL